VRDGEKGGASGREKRERNMIKRERERGEERRGEERKMKV
jgi:hypothetical protein